MSGNNLSIEHRLDSLETENRKLKRVALLLGIVVAASALFAFKTVQDPSERIVTEQIDIMRDGIVVATIGSDELGAIASFKNEEGTEYASIEKFEAGGGFSLYNNEENTVAWLGTVTNGNGMMKIYDKEGEQSVYSGADSETGNGFIDVYRRGGQRVAWFAATESGSGAVYVMNSEGEIVGGLNATDDGDGRMRLYSRNGDISVISGADSTSGNGYIDVYNSDGYLCGWLAATDDGNGGLNIYNNEGNLVAGMSVDDDSHGWMFTKLKSEAFASIIDNNDSGTYLRLYDINGTVWHQAP